MIKIPNICNFETSKGLIDILRFKINDFISDFKQNFSNSKSIFELFSENKDFTTFDKIIDEFEKNSLSICRFQGSSHLLLK